MNYKHMAKNVMLDRTCLWCKVKFQASVLEVKRGWGNFHSRKCKSEYHLAHGGRGPAKASKVARDNERIVDESFALYDQICAEEDEYV